MLSGLWSPGFVSGHWSDSLQNRLFKCRSLDGDVSPFLLGLLNILGVGISTFLLKTEDSAISATTSGLKGTVPRDFLPLVFSSNCSSWAQ